MTDHPHTPYITAVIDALTAAGLEPTDWWHGDLDGNPYGDGDLLNAVLAWDGDQPEAAGRIADRGMILLWEHPAEQWQYAERNCDGSNAQPEFLPRLGRYAQPDAVVLWARTLLAGQPQPDGHAPYWHEADAVRAAITTWEAAQ